jgi:hypothetical protein
MTTLEKLLSNLDAETLDNTFIEYFMLLLGSKRLLDRLNMYLDNTDTDMVSKKEILEILNSYTTNIEDIGI